MDTPGLVDGDMKYPFDVNRALLWLGECPDPQGVPVYRGVAPWAERGRDYTEECDDVRSAAMETGYIILLYRTPTSS